MCTHTLGIVAPYFNDSHKHRQIVLERCFLEVYMHAVCAYKELLKIVISNDQADGEANGSVGN